MSDPHLNSKRDENTRQRVELVTKLHKVEPNVFGRARLSGFVHES